MKTDVNVEAVYTHTNTLAKKNKGVTLIALVVTITKAPIKR